MVQRVFMFILVSETARQMSQVISYVLLFPGPSAPSRALRDTVAIFVFGALAVNSPGIPGYAQTQQRQNPDIGLDHKSVYRTP